MFLILFTIVALAIMCAIMFYPTGPQELFILEKTDSKKDDYRCIVYTDGSIDYKEKTLKSKIKESDLDKIKSELSTLKKTPVQCTPDGPHDMEKWELTISDNNKKMVLDRGASCEPKSSQPLEHIITIVSKYIN